MNNSLWKFPLFAFFFLVFASQNCRAQEYPTRPIRYIVPNSPGTQLDLVARIMAPEMAKLIGQPIVVDNRPGAGQVIGFEYVAKQAAADGYTVVVVNVETLAILPVTVKDLRFNPLQDLPPVIGLAEGRYIFGLSSKLPWGTFNELISFAKANPGKLNYGSSSSLGRLLTEGLIRDLGVKVTHVPYSAAGPGYQALLAGEVHMSFIGEAPAVSFGEKLRVLAVTGEQRRSTFRDAPTFAELGHPQVPGISFSLNSPAGVPKAAFDKLYATASRALQQPETRAQFAKIQLEIIERTPEAAAKKLAAIGKQFSDIANKIGFRPE